MQSQSDPWPNTPDEKLVRLVGRLRREDKEREALAKKYESEGLPRLAKLLRTGSRA